MTAQDTRTPILDRIAARKPIPSTVSPAPFIAPWRRRQIEQAGGRFVAVTDTTERAA